MTFTKETLRKDQLLRRDQKSRPQCGHYSEVLLYDHTEYALFLQRGVNVIYTVIQMASDHHLAIKT